MWVKWTCAQATQSRKRAATSAHCVYVTALATDRYIGSYAFCGCTSLTHISLVTTRVTRVDQFTFANCASLVSIGLPTTLTVNAVAAIPQDKSHTIDRGMGWWVLRSASRYMHADIYGLAPP